MDLENLIQVTLIFIGPIFYFFFKRSYLISSLINIFLGVLYYLIIRTPLCPYNGCVSLPTQHTWRDTIERFLETFFVFWKEKYSYIYTPKVDPILLSTGYVRHAFRAQNLFLSDQWYYNTSRAIITECLSIALNYYISFAIIIFIINNRFCFYFRKDRASCLPR